MEEAIKKPAPLPSHCDTPLTLNNARKALLQPAPGQYINPNNRCKKEYIEMQHIALLRPPEIFELSKFQFYLLNKFRPPGGELELTEYRQCHSVASELFELQVKSTLEDLGLERKRIPSNVLLNDSSLQTAFLRKAFFAEAVVMSSSKSITEGTWWKRHGGLIVFQQAGLTMICGSNLFIIQSVQLSALTSRDHLTILSDLAGERFSIKMQGILSYLTGSLENPFPEEIEKFINIGDRMLATAGNEAYDIVYGLESSCVSRFIGNYEGGDWMNSRFRLNIIEDQRKTAQKLNILELLEERETFLTTVFNRSPQALSQLYGLYRIWGHPTLEPLKGVIALKSKGLTPRRSLSHKAEEINNQFKEDFIIRYINHHKEWPLLNVENLSIYNIIRIHYERKLQYPLQIPGYNRDHLSLVQFCKIFPIDPKFDLIEFIDDKSISLGLPELIEEITKRKGIGSSLSRSLLLSFLKSDISDPEEFLKTIDLHGFPIEELCVGVHEKEREGKLKARLFGLLTLIKRSYVVLTEKLIADHLFPYFPEITMTDDERALEKKRQSFTTLKGKTYFISVDFSKWNTNMRHNDTETFYLSLDEMFGFTNCFQRTHEMFHPSFLYLIDGSYIPAVDGDTLKEGIGCWKHHLGGIEGLRQKGWTLWTVALIRSVTRRFDFDVRIMGQGDNQMLALTFPETYDSDTTTQQVNDFIKELDNMLSLIGPPLKMEETWVSQDFYLYGKYPILLGAPLIMSWKRSCRLFWCCNEDYPTIESSLSSLAANLFSGIASDNRTQELYYMYLFECIGCFQNNIRRPYLQRAPFPKLLSINPFVQIKSGLGLMQSVRIHSPISNSQSIQPEELYWGLLLCPRTLGGYPIVLYPSVLVKGFPDQLSYDIASLKAYLRVSHGTLQTIIKRVLNPYLSKDLNYELLSMNPEAINLEGTPSPAEARRGVMIDFLTHTEHVKQPYVKEFLNLVESNPNTELMNFLTRPHMLHPKLLNVIVQATAQYRAQQVIGKLQKTPTMAKLYQKEGEKDLYMILERSELAHFKSVLRFAFSDIKRPNLFDPSQSSVHHAQTLRMIGWQKEIIGVDCAPPHEIFVLEQVSPSVPCNDQLELDKGFITIRVCMNQRDCENTLKSGPVYPYRGSITKTKNDSIASKIKTSSPSLLKRMIAVTELHNWVYFPGTKLETLTKAMLRSLTDIPYELLTPDLDQVSGTAQHRLRVDRIDNGGTSPVLPTQSSKIQLDTSSFTFLVKGGKNMNFMFQAPLVMLLTTLGESLLNKHFNIEHGSIFHAHIKNSMSILPIDENPPDYSDVPLNLSLKSYPHSPFLYFPMKKLQPYINRSLKFSPVSRSHLQEETLNYRFHSLMAYDTLQVLDPWTWTSNQPPKQITNGITINWALNCDLVLYIKILTSLLLATFFNLGRGLDRAKFLKNILTIIKTSPIQSWENLTNLCFHPGFPSDLYRNFGMVGVQTQEVLTPGTVGRIIQQAVQHNLIQIMLSPSDVLLDNWEFWAPPSVSPVLHPYRVVTLLHNLATNSEITQITMDKLRDNITKQLNKNSPMEALYLIIDNKPLMLVTGISSESLDFLCKRLPPISTYDIPPSIKSTIFNVEDLNPSSTTVIHLKNPLSTGQAIYKLNTDHIKLKKNRAFHAYKDRPAPLPTSGSYKLLSIINTIKLPSSYIGVCLADGLGGFTRVLAQDSRCHQVWFNTIIKDTLFVPQMHPIPSVPDCDDLPYLETRKVMGLDLVNSYPSDITASTYPLFLSNHINNKVNLLTGDAESLEFYDPINTIKLFISYVRICIQLEVPICILKIHSFSPRVISACMHLLKHIYRSVKLMRSDFSLPSNSEYYIVCEDIVLPSTLNYTLTDYTLTFNTSSPTTLELQIREMIIGNVKPQEKNIMKRITYDFTTLLTRHISNQSLRDILISRHPWISHDNFAPDAVPYKYINSIYQWYRSLHRPKVEGTQSVKSRIRLEQFNTPEIIMIMTAYIFQYLYLLDTNKWDNWITNLLKDGVLLWGEMTSGDWTFLLHYSLIPPPEYLEHTKVYSVNSLITKVMIQRICRDVGLGSYLGLVSPSLPPRVSQDKCKIHTALFKTKVLFKNPLLNLLIKDSPELLPSTWKVISNHKNFQTRQERRIRLTIRNLET